VAGRGTVPGCAAQLVTARSDTSSARANLIWDMRSALRSAAASQPVHLRIWDNVS